MWSLLRGTDKVGELCQRFKLGFGMAPTRLKSSRRGKKPILIGSSTGGYCRAPPPLICRNKLERNVLVVLLGKHEMVSIDTTYHFTSFNRDSKTKPAPSEQPLGRALPLKGCSFPLPDPFYISRRRVEHRWLIVKLGWCAALFLDGKRNISFGECQCPVLGHPVFSGGSPKATKKASEKLEIDKKMFFIMSLRHGK